MSILSLSPNTLIIALITTLLLLVFLKFFEETIKLTLILNESVHKNFYLLLLLIYIIELYEGSHALKEVFNFLEEINASSIGRIFAKNGDTIKGNLFLRFLNEENSYKRKGIIQHLLTKMLTCDPTIRISSLVDDILASLNSLQIVYEGYLKSIDDKFSIILFGFFFAPLIVFQFVMIFRVIILVPIIPIMNIFIVCVLKKTLSSMVKLLESILEGV